MPAVAAVPLVTPNEAVFTVKAPKLETSKEFQGNGESDINLFSLSFLIPTIMPLFTCCVSLSLFFFLNRFVF